LVANPENAAALELTTMGAALRFEFDAVIAIAGADMGADIDGVSIPNWSVAAVKEGSLLTMGAVTGSGSRAYLAVRGGIDVPEYLGSRSTFILGKFGGHAGRPLRAGDIVHISDKTSGLTAASLSKASTPRYGNRWQIGVLFGPHTAPDFFTAADIEMFFATDWKVHYQIDRTGVRLVGPKPQWARTDGGEAGLHPSNIHDNAYAVGTVDFTGDMPILLGPDGPSLGGFVCPATVVEAELWKLGQLKAGDTVRFRRLSLGDAESMEQQLDLFLTTLQSPLPELPVTSRDEPAVLNTSTRRQTSVTYRADGDKYLLIEYGENKLDLALRLRVHWLEQKLRSEILPGIIDITPGIRSLHLHYDNRRLPRQALLEVLDSYDSAMPDLATITVPTRIVHMPLSWNDPAAQLAQKKYMQAVRPDAPWCPSNIEFIRRMNGLASIDDVYRIAFEASYLVLGLGDVYLGAPVATPLDPRHRLVTTKYNPARTWTPENAVGIGGAYLCVYGMEGPGGYQLIGRTVQVWNTTERARGLTPGSPWLLRFFDQIRFYPVSAEELLEARDALPHGRFAFRTEDAEFSIAKYNAFLESIRPEADAFKAKQKQAFDEERERWRVAGQLVVADETDLPAPEIGDQEIPLGSSAVNSPVTASVFKIPIANDQRVTAGEKLVVLDAMKTELVVKSPRAGRVLEVRCSEGQLVGAGQLLVVMQFD
jgi:urea carboxylase